MPLLAQDHSHLGVTLDNSGMMEEEKIARNRLFVRPFLDFTKEEEQLRQVTKFEERKYAGQPTEYCDDFIIKTYRLSKKKEEALCETLHDQNIKIFCNDMTKEELDAIRTGVQIKPKNKASQKIKTMNT